MGRLTRDRPKLRLLETIVVPDPEHGRVLVLRDTQGVAGSYASIPPTLVPILARFNGEETCEQIARGVSRESGQTVSVELVERLRDELDASLFLDTPAYRDALARVNREFRDAAVRPASHAGGAYYADPSELASYLGERCLDQATRAPSRTVGKSRFLAGLIAPHIDPWRGARGYGEAYAALKNGLAPEADTFVIFGTSHAPMQEPFALCRKGYGTPLGTMEADVDAIDWLAARCPYDAYSDVLNHKREHSIEFQAVFLKHILGDRPARIIPILASLGRHQALRTDPRGDSQAMALLEAVRELVALRGSRVVVIAGADLAHVGPRFGDPKGWGADQRMALERTDHDSLNLATAGDATGFWEQVAADLDTRRVCGLGPIYAMLETLPAGSSGGVLHYEQTIDAEDGSIVSHAAVAFEAPP
jgi:AmmeMemoRadiSam system protein B